jgi:serine/threonine-protein kinase
VTKFLSGASEADRRLDRFELIAELASGGMATVYLARLSGAGGFQRFVAIKRLHPHLAGDNEFVQMFLDEARLAARLHHPNVVPILEIGESPQGYYLVMEYVEGDTLARILARSAQAGRMLSPKVSMRICLDSIMGLHVAHELKDDDGQPLNIVHRDVSPQNILIGMDGSGRITDFGVARATTRLSTTRTGQLKGKLAYMAPEQARGAPVDRRADLFAMGIVLWECLAQKRLFKGEGEADTLNRVLYEPIPSLRQANPDVPPALEAVVMKALERDRDKRWSDASELADALERAARDTNCLGNHKDVATHLESVLGTDISAQRDAVRAWLARSEPSQRYDYAVPSNVSGGHSVSQPSQPSHSQSKPGVSSVSSAVIQLPGTHATQSGLAAGPSPIELPPRSRSKVWIGGAAAGVLLVAGVFVFMSMHNTRDGATQDKTGATQPPPPGTTAAPPMTTQASPPQPSATIATTDTAPQPTTTHAGIAHTPPGGTSKVIPHGGSNVGVKPPPTATNAPTATAQPTQTAAPTSTVDDISKNPYR